MMAAMWKAGRASYLAFIARAREFTPGTIEHLLFIGGLAVIAYGAWMVYKPAGFIIGGWFMVKLAYAMAVERK